MSDDNDIILEDGDERSTILQDQIDVIVTINEIDHSSLYEEWNEQKIKVLSMAMKIIYKTQQLTFKDLK